MNTTGEVLSDLTICDECQAPVWLVSYFDLIYGEWRNILMHECAPVMLVYQIEQRITGFVRPRD